MAAAAATVVPVTLSQDRIEPGSSRLPPVGFPAPNSTESVNADLVISELINQLNSALSSNNYQALTELYCSSGYWRDHLCLSWDFRTFKSSDLAAFMGERQPSIQFEVDKSSSTRAPQIGPIDSFGEVMGPMSFVKVTTKDGYGRGIIRLTQEDGKWKIFTISTSLEGLKDHEESTGHRRPFGVQHGAYAGRKNWLERRVSEMNFEEKTPAVIVVGAGQAGLTVAARLKMLNVETLVVDNVDRVGDSWRRRYHQLVLHDPVWYDHLPYVQFPPNWPIFTPKDKLADFFESYAKILELNIWTKSNVKSSSWDESKRQWTVVVERQKEDGSTETRTFHPRHVIQATGHSGKKNMPKIKGMEAFKGDRLCHSSEFPGASSNSEGKKAIVVGSCNSGHDIAQAYYEKGYDVTIIQRSSTCVVSSKSITEIGLRALYGQDGPVTEDADLLLWALPSELFKTQQSKVSALMSKEDAKTLEGLEKAGFKVDKGTDSCGLMIKYLQRGGGYYIDVGASKLIADGKIKVKHGQEITEVLPNGLKFADGSELAGDEIIFATGYENMRTQARIIFGDELADRIGDVWGFDEEGEMRTIWRRSGHPGFWFMGGNLALCRYYSRLLALQIKALEEGVASPEKP